MLSFENTQIAFQSKSDKALKRAHFLFRVLGRKWMVNFGKQFTNFCFKLRLPIGGIIRNTIFKQFVGGTSIADCEESIELLNQYKVGTILDYSVEGKEDEESFGLATDEIIRTIQKAESDQRIPFCVFKVSGLGRHYILVKQSEGKLASELEREEWKRIENRVNRICEEAAFANQPIFIDAEESWIQPAIDELAVNMMRKYNTESCIIYNTAQLYRHDRLDYIRNLYSLALGEGFLIGLKLVRGAYMEKERIRAREMSYPDPIQVNKEASDNDFNIAADFCLSHLDRIGVCLGTHNEESCFQVAQRMGEMNIPVNHPHLYFAQLLGMSDHISFNLSNAGYNVVKYVPYGPVKEVVPYLIRRAEENTSVKGQTGRELSLIKRELERRKSVKTK